MVIWVSAGAAADTGCLMELFSLGLFELARHRGLYGLHAAAVRQEETGYLLPGPSGSGKTSLALALVRERGFRYLTDDFVFLTQASNGVRCVPFLPTFHVDPAWGDHYGELSFVRQLPPLAQGKRNLDPAQLYPGSHAAECRPTVIAFPRIVDAAESALRPMPESETFRRLLRESPVSPDGRVVRRQLDTLAALVRQAASYELLHGRDFLQDPGRTITSLLERLQPGGAGL
jgi:hypothetical protein